MFNNLSEKLDKAFHILKGHGKITEVNVAETLKEVSRALLDADVNFKIAKDFTTSVKEKELIKQIELYPEVIQDAAKNHSPALIANYTYDLVKEFNSFYQNVSILGEENSAIKVFRVQLSKKVADTIKSAFQLLGIEVPERM